MKLSRVCIVCLILVPFLSYSQREKDTTNVYHKLHNKASKHRVTRWVYEAMFEDPAQVENDNPPIPEKNKTANAFVKYKGGIIRSVNIIVLDPFGYSVNNMWSSANPDYLEKLGNKYHIT